jgi:hypothetical protein
MIRLVALLLLGTALASCGTYQANVGKVVDMIPEWVGGLPKGVPPRPGTPEYEAHRKGIDERGTGGAQPQDAKKIRRGTIGPPLRYSVQFFITTPRVLT